MKKKPIIIAAAALLIGGGAFACWKIPSSPAFMFDYTKKEDGIT